MAENGLRPDFETKNLTYIYTQALAKAYVQREMKRQKTSSLTYSFSSLTAYSAGGFYKLQDSVTGINTVVRILSCNQSADGLYSVKTESASTMSISDIALKELYYSDMESSPDTAFRIKASRTVFTLSTDVSVLEVSGEIAASDEISFKWFLSDDSFDEGKSIDVYGSNLSAGSNKVTVKAFYQSVEVASTSINLILLQGKDGKDGEDGLSFTVVIESSNGDVFRPGDIDTTLTCRVYLNTAEVTDDIPESRFNWKRRTSDGIADERWNTSSKAVGHRSVDITSADCNGRTVFGCEVDLPEI